MVNGQQVFSSVHLWQSTGMVSARRVSVLPCAVHSLIQSTVLDFPAYSRPRIIRLISIPLYYHRDGEATARVRFIYSRDPRTTGQSINRWHLYLLASRSTCHSFTVHRSVQSVMLQFSFTVHPKASSSTQARLLVRWWPCYYHRTTLSTLASLLITSAQLAIPSYTIRLACQLVCGR